MPCAKYGCVRHSQRPRVTCCKTTDPLKTLHSSPSRFIKMRAKGEMARAATDVACGEHGQLRCGGWAPSRGRESHEERAPGRQPVHLALEWQHLDGWMGASNDQEQKDGSPITTRKQGQKKNSDGRHPSLAPRGPKTREGEGQE
jgi:hypothetical protein